MELYCYKAEVVKVVDGDTLDLHIDLGFDIAFNLRVRLAGVNAPETRTGDLEEKAAGLAAKEYVKSWLDRRGYSVFIRTEKDKAEKYGRILANVFDITGVDCLNNDMVTDNMAKPYFGGKR
jgi:micrococcal nuclease